MSRTESTLNPIDPVTFRQVCARFATGITVATAVQQDGQPFGFTANSFTSVSCSPPIVLICIDHRSSALAHFRSHPVFGINILDSTQAELSVRFSQSPPEDRFRDIEWTLTPAGVPLLAGVLATLECSVMQFVDAGDHTVLLGEVFRTQCRDGLPLVFYGSAYCSLSDFPKSES